MLTTGRRSGILAAGDGCRKHAGIRQCADSGDDDDGEAEPNLRRKDVPSDSSEWTTQIETSGRCGERERNVTC